MAWRPSPWRGESRQRVATLIRAWRVSPGEKTPSPEDECIPRGDEVLSCPGRGRGIKPGASAPGTEAPHPIQAPTGRRQLARSCLRPVGAPEGFWCRFLGLAPQALCLCPFRAGNAAGHLATREAISSYACCRRGTSRSISAASRLCIACHRSQSCWRPSQKSADMPRTRASRSAVSGVTERLRRRGGLDSQKAPLAVCATLSSRTPPAISTPSPAGGPLGSERRWPWTRQPMSLQVFKEHLAGFPLIRQRFELSGIPVRLSRIPVRPPASRCAPPASASPGPASGCQAPAPRCAALASSSAAPAPWGGLRHPVPGVPHSLAGARQLLAGLPHRDAGQLDPFAARLLPLASAPFLLFRELRRPPIGY
jgi:hypothetical protein